MYCLQCSQTMSVGTVLILGPERLYCLLLLYLQHLSISMVISNEVFHACGNRPQTTRRVGSTATVFRNSVHRSEKGSVEGPRSAEPKFLDQEPYEESVLGPQSTGSMSPDQCPQKGSVQDHGLHGRVQTNDHRKSRSRPRPRSIGSS